jgi:hypothetical protein
MPAPAKVRDLMALFERNSDDYLSANYNETQVRLEFINPFFKCLGWDMENEKGYAKAYEDVVHESALMIDLRHSR